MQLQGDLLLTSKVKIPAVIEMPEWQLQDAIVGSLVLTSKVGVPATVGVHECPAQGEVWGKLLLTSKVKVSAVKQMCLNEKCQMDSVVKGTS